MTWETLCIRNALNIFFSENTNTGAINACEHPEVVGDGICQKRANNYVCDFDGGDCCRVTKMSKWCSLTSDCACHEELDTLTTTTTTTKVILTLPTTTPFVPPGLDDNFVPPGQQKND